jgi:phosphoserine phosphatase RsbU/P
VGGDYYDFIPIDRERCAICIGDIAGKGLSAALLMANLQATLHRFMTCFYGILDRHNHTLTYCNAGHDPPLLFKDRLLHLHADNLILGTFAGIDYTEQTIPIDPGDMLVMYSDGVTESKNENDEEFGSERLSEIIINHRSQTAEAILEKIMKSVCCYSDGCPQADDITVVVVKREG